MVKKLNDGVAIKWRLQAVMTDRGFKRPKDLQQALSNIGEKVSSTSMSRLVYHEPKSLSLDLLQNLCAVLHCTPNELMVKGDQDVARL